MSEKFDVRLLDATYTVKDDEPVVILYGKTRDNKSITLLYPDFAPYCHVMAPPAGLRRALTASPDVASIEDITLEYKGRKEPFVKVVTHTPWAINQLKREYDVEHKNIHCAPPAELVEQMRADGVTLSEYSGGYLISLDDRVYAPQLVEKYGLLKYMDRDEQEKWECKAAFFAADIQYTNRFIYDMDLECCMTITAQPLPTKGYTTDIVAKALSFEKCHPFNPKIRYTSVDIETSIKYKNMYCICLSTYDEATDQWTGKIIRSKFGVRHDNATSDEHRAWDMDEAVMLLNFVDAIRETDPDIITGYNINNFDLNVMYEAGCKLLGKKENQDMVPKLNYGRDGRGVSKRTTQAGTNLWEVKGRLILDAWAFVKKELKPKRETLGFVAQQLFNDSKDPINSSKMDDEWATRPDEVTKYCLKDAELALKILRHPKINTVNKLMDLAIPAKLPIKEISGGTSRMIESVLLRMVDREGVAVPCNNNQEYEYEGAFVYPTKPGLWEWVIGLDFSSMYPSQIKKHNICFTTYCPDKSKAAEVSPIGAGFCSKQVRHGIIPRMVQGFLDSRNEAKAMKKKCKAAGDTDMADYYDRLQAAIKVMANATYGYFGTKFCRWPYNQYIAPSITAWAREEITTVVKELESRGCTVLAGDTDSVMFKAPGCEDVDSCVKFGKEVQEQFSKGGMLLDLEKVMQRFFAHAKKRYFGKIVWPEPSILVRGYETRRTDSFDLLGNTLTHVFELILEGQPDEAVKYAKGTMDKVKDGKVSVSDLVISKSVKDFDEYKNPETMMGCNAARKMMAQGFEFNPGMKYSFVVTNSEAKPIDVEPVIEGVQFTATPDYQYYAQRVATALCRITETFGCDERALMQGNKQRSLAAFF